MAEAKNRRLSMRLQASMTFFTPLELKDGARPIADTKLVSPADGAVSQLGKIELGRVFQAKGRDFSVTELFRWRQLSRRTLFER